MLVVFTYVKGGKLVGNEPIEKAVCIVLEGVDTFALEIFIDDGADVKVPFIGWIVIVGVVLKSDDNVWFERFNENETDDRVVVVIFWVTVEEELVSNELFETVAWVLFAGVETLWFETFDDDEMVVRMLVVFWLKLGGKVVNNELLEAVGCVLFRNTGNVWLDEFDGVDRGARVVLKFWFEGEDKFVGNEVFEIVAWVLFVVKGKLWFVPFDDGETVVGMLVVFWAKLEGRVVNN